MCDKGFTKSAHFTNHKQSHTKAKLFIYDLCDKVITQSLSLTTHNRSHTASMLYKCDMCDKGFTQYPHLTIHKHTHTGVKPFKCDLCDKEITQSGNLPKFNNINKVIQDQCQINVTCVTRNLLNMIFFTYHSLKIFLPAFLKMMVVVGNKTSPLY